LLERLAAGELPAMQERDLRERLAATGEEHRLEALAASNAEILTAHPAAQVTAEVRRRASLPEWGARRPSRRRTIAGGVGNPPRVPISIARPVWALSFATAGAAAIVLLLMRAPAGPSQSRPLLGEPTQETITIKGLQPSLGLYRKTAAGVERLWAAARVRPGDIVQVRYIAAGKSYGVVASCDARGAVTLHLPETPGQAVALTKDGERALAHSYELDSSPGFERFVFVTADAPFDTELVVRSLKENKALPRDFSSWSITLEKETP
jgi:hypothetical protein